MMSTIRCAGIALLAMSVAVSVCSAQEAVIPPAPDSTVSKPVAAPTDSTPHAAAKPTMVQLPGNTPRRGGLGGLIGGSWFYAADDYSKGAHPRFDFAGHWRYGLSPRWRWQLGVGFTWSAYSKTEPPPFTDPAYPAQTTKEGYLTQIIPADFQFQYMWGAKRTLWHVGAGPNLTHIIVQNQRDVLKDPVTFALHRGFALGASGEVGMERYFAGLPSTSFEINATTHYVFASNDDKWPTGFSSPLGALCVRMGANYYFDVKNLKKKTPEKLPLSSKGGGKKP